MTTGVTTDDDGAHDAAPLVVSVDAQGNLRLGAGVGLFDGHQDDDDVGGGDPQAIECRLWRELGAVDQPLVEPLVSNRTRQRRQ